MHEWERGRRRGRETFFFKYFYVFIFVRERAHELQGEWQRETQAAH